MPPQSYKYDKQYLELARRIEQSSGRIIINPRNIDAVSLLEADADWIASRNTYLETLRFFTDYDKNPASK